MNVAISRWAAWAPGLECREDWERWCHAPGSLAAEGAPDVRFLPPLLRRRCNRLTRVLLHVAFAACEPEHAAALPTVIGSRYGELGATVALLETLARQKSLSASAFTHSVHNAPVGLFSIASRNRQMASAVAAGATTFAHSFIEGLVLLERAPGAAVLVVVGDEPLPAVFDAFRDEPPATYAVAFVIERAGLDRGVTLEPAPPDRVVPRPPWPQGVEFLRWWLSSDESVTLGTTGRGWTWSRPT